jgi:hypothetical protein
MEKAATSDKSSPKKLADPGMFKLASTNKAKRRRSAKSSMKIESR